MESPTRNPLSASPMLSKPSHALLFMQPDPLRKPWSPLSSTLALESASSAKLFCTNLDGLLTLHQNAFSKSLMERNLPSLVLSKTCLSPLDPAPFQLT